ncbi:MAG: 23S rRNA (adenine(2503)-C(2))-methyltransferase RlmN [Gammaproteobacteria bacterium]|uniref:Dual-specificity RNA methyltransferase RlmN n=1 Tax=Marinobacter nitratireducens TaxID=1137280 RepID=A0A072N5Q6_9GAMM|nr:23S rRNA (adenine(2503)-C(2))-methyltransferase RlmN [Marinobacter nitratireducens]KEF32577.1 Ribosomal RNA large subunit methyltransferase N [Marinobacter nitratireducens]TNE73849.1 MAG: 23S rRNA (adenine(2503)-C(2))-methyltransferase RlmN [Gammaproteobacteria bacterium]TNE95546.1 MAG: 23S rRNA (adenine(2503)-C(2))-methyltransferase RlmN [Gammaproteobacteria bacterium]
MTAAAERVNLLGMPKAKLEAYFESLGEKRFRAQQVLQWIHQRGVDDFDQMTNMSKSLREKLKLQAEVRGPEVIYDETSKDGTRKWVMRMDNGNSVETVLIPDGERGTLCVSSQIGCSLDCTFCSTGKRGFNRNLTAAEIIGQVWVARKAFMPFEPGPDRPITNVVMMGMGEPLLNFDNVVDAMNLMMEDLAYGISKRRVTLSTSGVVPALDRLGEVTDVSLAISLHAPNDELRNKLVPLNKKYPIAELLAATKRYLAGLPDKRKATIEYTVIEGMNDQPEHARQLAELLRGLPCKINLIPFNPFPESDFRRPSKNATRRFQTVLNELGYIATIRTTRGDDIDAACGQLVGRVEDRTRRSQRYIQVQQVNP